MAENDQLLEKIGNLIDQKLEPIKRDMATRSDLQEVKQSQAQTNTALEALAAGQESTKAELKVDIHDLRVDLVKKVKNHESRIENLEEHTGTFGMASI